ncbi:MAG TPA: FAD-dependent oxidoreductase [Patescibacteria group bacterium]|nr:FAD-dependent oxidoreductase [Patescibacteria group bacterium]
MAEARNVIVIGGASAGYTAAIYLARATLSPLVLAGENAGGQLMFTTEVENFPGFSKGIRGPDLMMEMRAQAERFGAEIQNANVTKIDFSGGVKRVWVGETEYQAKAVILALGAMSRMLKVGEENFLGRGVSTCAVCDAAFFKDKTVFVVGGGDAAMEDVLALARFTDKVTVIYRKGEFKASKIMQARVGEKNIPVLWETEVTGVMGENKLEKIRIKDKAGEKELSADGLFLAIGHIPATDILKGQVELDSHDYLITKMTAPTALSASNAESVAPAGWQSGGQASPQAVQAGGQAMSNQEIWLNDYPTQTSVAGVFGAGDMVDIRYRQAITAAGMGCMAALDAEKFLTGTIQGW